MTLHPSTSGVCITFGKHCSKSMYEIYNTDRNYLTWLINTPSIPKIWRDAAMATDPKRWLETLSFSEQFERICSMYVLPNLGYTHFDNDVWKTDTQIGNLPLEFRADMITREHENILQAAMIGKTKEEFLDWWNNLVPSVLGLSSEDYDGILVNPVTPCNHCT